MNEIEITKLSMTLHSKSSSSRHNVLERCFKRIKAKGKKRENLMRLIMSEKSSPESARLAKDKYF